MPFREKLRKFKSDTKSRIFPANEGKSTNSTIGQSSTTPVSGTQHKWTYLRALLKSLEQATRPLSPLKAAVADLAECVDIFEAKYEALFSELERLFQMMHNHCAHNTPPVITMTVESLCKSLQEEAVQMRQRQDKGRLREYLEADQNVEEVLACYQRIHGYLQRISLNADMSVWRIVDEIATDNRLKHLSPSLSARYNSAQAIELKRGPCTEGTRIDLLSQLLGWVDSSNSGSVYWMSGMAGTGKTTIAYTLCLELEASRRLAASFFCSRLLPECRDINLVIPSIAYQLARLSHPFRFVLSSVLEKDPDLHTQLPHIQFNALIAQPLLEVKETLPDSLVVVIDALDECENKESTSQILDVLLTRASDLPVKFVVSSRPEPEIRDEMTKQTDRVGSRVVLHELDKDTVQADIEIYLRAALDKVHPSDDQIATLVQRAGILFIYAATVVRYIGHDRFRRNPLGRLANILESSSMSENKYKEIDELYTTILRAALDDESLDGRERKDMQQVLHTVICAYEPLTLKVLSGILRIHKTDRIHAALRPLWSVLHISGASELVTTLHASFPDYMLDPALL
ncbi:hypothetical protein OPQ81_005531 [Rhizoctonia solani]|nr:hypothetical protein OPQ81_005531 [Rhizoctonia solani]